jgi:hypothetical protein
MGFLLRKTQMLVDPFNSLLAVFAELCLLIPKNRCQTPLHRHHHRKSTSVDLNLLPYAELSLTKRHTPRSTAILQSA